MSSPWTHSEQNASPQLAYNVCSSYLKAKPYSLDRVASVLRHPDTNPGRAIREILTYLKNHPEWNGERKYREWEELVHVYNAGRSNYWVNAPCLKTKEGHIVCWGETRGHLLIFRTDGVIFKSYDPMRPNPTQGPNGYQIDWDDPTLNSI